MRNKHIDLSDIYDSCYSGYDDYTAELTLERDADSGTWQNDSVKFYNTTDYGWAYEETPGRWNYGYDSLEEAVTKYTGGIAAGFCLSRLRCIRRLIAPTKDVMSASAINIVTPPAANAAMRRFRPSMVMVMRLSISIMSNDTSSRPLHSAAFFRYHN